MTQPDHPRDGLAQLRRPHGLQVRRPAAPVGTGATVTQLCPPGADREPVAVASVQGTLALDLGLEPAAPLPPELNVVPGDTAPEHREVQAWAARFAQATVEVLGGDRPVSQLLRWTTARVYRDLERRVRILGRTAAAPQRLRTVRPQVRSVHVCQPSPETAEVSVHVRHGHRSRALAARLEQRDGRWRCVVLELG
jgi:Family of unknown function (DUF6459)